MTLPDERQLRKQFITVRNNLARKISLASDSSTDLHSILFDSCMKSVESGVTNAISDFNDTIKKQLVPAKNLKSLMKTARAFEKHPAVVASLFELKPEIESKKDGSNAKYGEQHGERRRSGRFFTPLVIAEFMAHVLIGEYCKSNAMRDLKILDPSVGAGIFLDVVYSELERRNIKSKDILDSLYGADLDSDAVELSKRVLIKKSGGGDIQNAHFHQGDFLLDNLIHPDSGYDLIIGNPPYIAYYSRESHIDTDELKSRLVKRYKKAAGGSANTFLCFLIRSIELLKDGGMLCFIVPDKLLWNRRYHKIRKYILDNAPPRALFNVGENVFQGATVGNVIVLLEKTANLALTGLGRSKERPCEKNICTLSKLTLDNRDNTISVVKKEQVPIQKFAQQKDLKFIVPDALSEKIAAKAIPLKEIAHVRDGINPAFAEFRSRILSDTKKGKTYQRLIEGADITPFKVKARDLFINYDKSLVTPELQKRGVSFREEWIFTSPLKLVNRQTADKLIFALDENKFCSLNSVHNTILRDGCHQTLNLNVNGVQNENTAYEMQKAILHFLLGILNSRLMNYYYRSITSETAKTFPQVHIADLKELPVRIPDEMQFEKIAHCVELIRTADSDISNLLIELDDAVFGMYRMSQKQRERIIRHTEPEWRIV